MEEKKFVVYLKLVNACKCEACKLIRQMITDEAFTFFNLKQGNKQ